MGNRKIVQISVSPCHEKDREGDIAVTEWIYALCNDQSVWFAEINMRTEIEWRKLKLPAIPQEEARK